jgi:NADH:ubiquinone oxidoreductase subunit H
MKYTFLGVIIEVLMRPAFEYADTSIFWAVLEFLILALGTIVPLLVAIAYYTLAERKVMASIQRRKGPNVVGL